MKALTTIAIFFFIAGMTKLILAIYLKKKEEDRND
jgi:hypothetical protein